MNKWKLIHRCNIIWMVRWIMGCNWLWRIYSIPIFESQKKSYWNLPRFQNQNMLILPEMVTRMIPNNLDCRKGCCLRRSAAVSFASSLLFVSWEWHNSRHARRHCHRTQCDIQPITKKKKLSPYAWHSTNQRTVLLFQKNSYWKYTLGLTLHVGGFFGLNFLHISLLYDVDFALKIWMQNRLNAKLVL